VALRLAVEYQRLIMKLVRFGFGMRIHYGVLDGDEVRVIAGSPFDPGACNSSAPPLTGERFGLEEVRLLAPCTPSKYIGIGLNYAATAKAVNLPLPQSPMLFLRPSTAVIGPDQDIVLPRNSSKAIAEGELALVIGRQCRDIAEDEVEAYVFGYTIANDIMDIGQFLSDQGNPTRSKAHDTFGPLGPSIVTGLYGRDLSMQAFVNGRKVQSGNVRDMVFGVAHIVSYISHLMTLLPGDVIATGAPPVPSEVVPGDLVEVHIEEIGVLRNQVVAAV
jgi:2-keto-4-pentenoate hydratase/2-oxohepta-3-ene-1,7-dioic acid hydratase in catechol pathway